MRLFLSLAAHFKHCEGRLYSMELAYDLYASRYLGVFDEVLIVARSAPVSSPPDGWHEVTGPRVTCVPLPDYLGPWQFMRVRGKIRQLIDEAIAACDCFTLRVPCDIGNLAWHCLRQRGLPYTLEVVGDPWLALSPGSNRSVVRPLARRLSRRALRRECQEAAAAIYVTKKYLQTAYPPGPTTIAIGCSDVDLTPEMFADNTDRRAREFSQFPERLKGTTEPIRLGYIGTLQSLYKAPDVHIEAVAHLRQRGLNVRLELVGGGNFLDSLQELARLRGVSDAVTFVGRLPGGMAIAQFLDSVDLFLNASRQEGLPRALLEAMARGCPAIGSRAGGISELLTDEFLVPVGDAVALAAAIARILASPAQMIRASVRNLDLAHEYADEILQKRRQEFYLSLRQAFSAHGRSEHLDAI